MRMGNAHGTVLQLVPGSTKGSEHCSIQMVFLARGLSIVFCARPFLRLCLAVASRQVRYCLLADPRVSCAKAARVCTLFGTICHICIHAFFFAACSACSVHFYSSLVFHPALGHISMCRCLFSTLSRIAVCLLWFACCVGFLCCWRSFVLTFQRGAWLLLLAFWLLFHFFFLAADYLRV